MQLPACVPTLTLRCCHNTPACLPSPQVPVKLWASLLRMELEYEAQHERIERAYGPYYYLSYIGTRAESRGKGYASLLLKQVGGLCWPAHGQMAACGPLLWQCGTRVLAHARTHALLSTRQTILPTVVWLPCAPAYVPQGGQRPRHAHNTMSSHSPGGRPYVT